MPEGMWSYVYVPVKTVNACSWLRAYSTAQPEYITLPAEGIQTR